jgi:CDP-paratose 2-epimerase
MNKIDVTGSIALIGSRIVERICALGWQVYGIDSNMRIYFFRPQGDTRWNRSRLLCEKANCRHEEINIRDRNAVATLIKNTTPVGIVHTAAQPIHMLLADKKRPNKSALI